MTNLELATLRHIIRSTYDAKVDKHGADIAQMAALRAADSFLVDLKPDMPSVERGGTIKKQLDELTEG